MRKIDDEEISRILSIHAVRQMVRYGGCWPDDHKCCIGQAINGYLWADKEFTELVKSFDREYNKNWTIDQFVQWIADQDIL